MKLTLHQLPKHFTQNKHTIYLLTGDEPLLMQDAMDIIHDLAKQMGYSEVKRLSVDTANDLEQSLYAASHSISLFADKQLVELNLSSLKLNQAVGKILTEYSEQTALHTLLILRAQKLETSVEKTKWFQALEKNIAFIPLWPITIEQLPQWIFQRAKKKRLDLTDAAAELLAQQVEGNLLAAAQEIEKLILLQLDQTIKPETIAATVTDHSRFDIFALMDSALHGNMNRSLHILKSLSAENIEPTLVLWAITRELRLLADIQTEVKTEQASLPHLFNKFRIWEKRQGSIRRYLQRCTLSDTWNCLAFGSHIDHIIKGAEEGHIWEALEALILKILGRPELVNMSKLSHISV